MSSISAKFAEAKAAMDQAGAAGSAMAADGINKVADTAGKVMDGVSIAADIGLSLIPGVGGALKLAKQGIELTAKATKLLKTVKEVKDVIGMVKSVVDVSRSAAGIASGVIQDDASAIAGGISNTVKSTKGSIEAGEMVYKDFKKPSTPAIATQELANDNPVA